MAPAHAIDGPDAHDHATKQLAPELTIDGPQQDGYSSHTAAEAAAALSGAGVLQGEFQTFEELVDDHPWCSLENPLFGEIDQPGVGRVMAPRVPLTFSGSPAANAVPAPQLGGIQKRC